MNILGNRFFYSNSMYGIDNIDLLAAKGSNRLYEILRVIDGQPLFYTDHYNRFVKSLTEMEVSFIPSKEYIYRKLIELIRLNYIEKCNVKFEVILKGEEVILAIYLVPFAYPAEEAYSKGVMLGTYHIEREHPHVKQSKVNDSIRKKIKSVLNNPELFEVLLVDHNENITEGSRSNVFFIKGQALVSPPSDTMLEGITRKKVIEIVRRNSIGVYENPIPFKSLNEYDACFITGTSPKVLPVRSINEFHFNPSNVLLRAIMDEYNQLIQHSLSEIIS